jgi:hypothetical protein
MDLAGRRENWKGSAIGVGAFLLIMILGPWLRTRAGESALLLAVVMTAAAVAWYCGRWAGILASVGASMVAAYFALPPVYSLRITGTQESTALYSFALAGVIASLLCGAAWQLRLEARTGQAGQREMNNLRIQNLELRQKIEEQSAALAASDRLIQEFAKVADSFSAELAAQVKHAVRNTDGSDPVQVVDCNALVQRAKARFADAGAEKIFQGALPTVWGEETEVARLFEMLVFRAIHNSSVETLSFSASRLPESYLFNATFRKSSSTPPLTELEFCTCNRIVARQGGRCWSNARGEGDWELMFLLPRRSPLLVKASQN